MEGGKGNDTDVVDKLSDDIIGVEVEASDTAISSIFCNLSNLKLSENHKLIGSTSIMLQATS